MFKLSIKWFAPFCIITVINGNSYGEKIELVASESFFKNITVDAGKYTTHSITSLNSDELIQSIASGNDLVWIGSGKNVPAELWIGSFEIPGSVTGKFAPSSPLSDVCSSTLETKCESAWLKAPTVTPMHNSDEEPRGDFLPIIEAHDKWGSIVGYSGVLFQHKKSSLAKNRFDGAQCYFLLFPDPINALEKSDWEKLLTSIESRANAKLWIDDLKTNYAGFRAGESVQLEAVVKNTGGSARAVHIEYEIKSPSEDSFRPLANQRRVPAAGDNLTTRFDFPAPPEPGLWAVRAKLYRDPDAKEISDSHQWKLIDQYETGFVALSQTGTDNKFLKVEESSLQIQGQKSFWAGTNYYPSGSWWELLWTDFHPAVVDRDFRSMRESGYRIARIWIDTDLNEQSLRSMDACIELAAKHGIVVDITLFTQWVNRMSYVNEQGVQQDFEFRKAKDFNVYGVSFRNMDHQKKFVSILANRWKKYDNIIWNLTNETYVNDPDKEQLDPMVEEWKNLAGKTPSERSTEVFRSWSNLITKTIREAGATQPVMPGYLFSTLNGGDSLKGQIDADMTAWHSYDTPQRASRSLRYMDSTCHKKPFLFEEFGKLGWNPQVHYEACAYYGFVSGAAATMSYEWGIGWLADELSFNPLPMRLSLDAVPDSRTFMPAVEQAKTWKTSFTGSNPYGSGWGYGSIYHGTSIPAGAAVALGRIGLIGGGLEPEPIASNNCLVIPNYEISGPAGIETVSAFMEKLENAHAVYRVVQEDCLSDVANSTKIFYVPSTVSSKTLELLKQKESAGAIVLTDIKADLNQYKDIERLELTSAKPVRTIARGTSVGRLYGLFSNDSTTQTATVKLPNGETISFGNAEYSLIHSEKSGVTLIEAADSITVGNTKLCSFTNGRIAIKSEIGESLENANTWTVYPTCATEITCSKTIKSIVLHDNYNNKKINTIVVNSSKATLTEDFLRYKIQLVFE